MLFRSQDTMKKSERISISNNGTTIDHKTSDENEKEQIKSETDEIAIKIESALEDLNVPGKITHIKHGPRVSLYAILLARYVSLRDFKNAKEDLAFRLGVNAVRILAPIPYTPYVGIEVPNKELVSVSFRDITENPEVKSLLASGLSALLGRDLSGNLVSCDLKKQGHLQLPEKARRPASVLSLLALYPIHLESKLDFLLSIQQLLNCRVLAESLGYARQ